MTVSSTNTKNSYSGDGSTAEFNYTFKLIDDDDITVIIRTNATGDETVKSKGTHYTVTGVGNDGGGAVTFTAGNTPASTETVVLLRDTAQTQTTDYTPNDPFPASSHESALDKVTFLAQEIQEELDRAIKISRTNTITSSEFTIGPADRANKIFAFDGNGDFAVTQEIGTYRGTDATITTTSYVARDLVKSTTTAQLDNVYIALQASAAGTSLTNTTYWALIVDAVTAAQSIATSAASAAAAAASETAAAASETAAATSETNSATSETNAATSETNSANSATASANSAAASAVSATTSANEATDSANSATASAASAATASTQATNSASSATTATTQAGIATTQAGIATTKAGEASTSASNAATSETNASTSATNAATSAANSANSETASATSESNASTSETNAATSETNALASKTAAANSASAAATSESNSATSASASATSASQSASSASAASTSETNSATSATNSANSASAASTSASNAASSASSASSAQTAAESARDATLAAYDNFDDRYLGTKSTAPTVDNDGDALVAGALYFDSVAGAMYVYTGSAWVAAYVSGTGFLALTGGTMTGDINFGDNDKATFGAGSDLQVFHSGTHSWINENGTGNLYIQSSGAAVNITNGSTRNLAQFNTTAGTATLYYDNGTSSSAKLATTASGINVTGTVVSDGLTVDGVTKIGVASAPTWDTNSFLWTEAGVGLNVESYRVKVNTGSSRIERMHINANGDISFYDSTGVSQGFLWDASGQNLGIGTTTPNPNAKLHVSGGRSYFASNSNAFATYLRYNDTTAGVFVGSSAANEFRVSASSGALRLNIDAEGRLTSSGTGSGDIGIFKTTANSGTGLYINSQTTNQIDLVGYDGSAANAVNIRAGGATGSGLIVDTSGNVGIGTNAPAALMHLKQTTGNAILRINSDSGERRIDFGDATDDDGGRIKYDGSDNLQFYTSGTERVRIDSDGRVGIGTQSPSSYGELAVYKASGNVEAAVVTGGANYATYRLQNNARRYSMQIRTDQSNSFVIRDETASANRLIVDTSGNVGIGGSPTSPLHVQTTGQRVGAFISTGSDPQVYIGDATSSDNAFILGYDRADNRGYLTVAGDSDNVFTIANGGNVGIGTAAPSSGVQLDVRGTGVLQLVNTDTVQLLASNGGSTLKNVSNNPLIFGTNNTERMRFTSYGDVGIGRSDPQNIVGNHGGGLVIRSDAGRASTTTLFAVQSSNSYNMLEHLHNGQFRLRNKFNTQLLLVDTSGNATFSGSVSATGGFVGAGGETKVWAKWNGEANSLTNSFNVSSASDTGAGLVGININNNMDYATYAITAMGGYSDFVQSDTDRSTSTPDSTSRYDLLNANYNFTRIDSANMNSAVLGDLA